MKKIIVEGYEPNTHKENIEELINNLREVDKMEARAMGYDRLREAVDTSLNYAYISFVAKGEDNTTLCIFGLSSLVHSEYGRAVWFLGTKEMDNYSREFVYYSKIIINEMLKEHDRLYNYISVYNDKSIRWLKRLGASFSEPFLINGEEFILFVME